MRFDRDPRLETELLDRLREKYTHIKPIPHLTEVLYCLTRSYYDRTDPLPITKKELLYFAVGFALEAVLLRGEPKLCACISTSSEGWVDGQLHDGCPCKGSGVDTGEPQSQQLDGLWLTPDYIDLQDTGVDLKSTRMWSTPEGVPKMGWPDSWLEQFKGYAKWMQSDGSGHTSDMVGPEQFKGCANMISKPVRPGPPSDPHRLRYSVGIVYLGQPDLVTGTFTFTQEEIDSNWDYIMDRKKTYEDFWFDNQVPTPYKYNKEWECKNCRYQGRCAIWKA